MVKDRIIEAASELFGQTGVKSTTMDDIARHLGISKRTIYENFKDKEAVLIACIEEVNSGNRAFTEKVFREADNVAEAILMLLQKTTEQKSQWRIDMINDIRKCFPQVYKDYLLKSHMDRYRGMEKLIQKGMDEGVFRSDLIPAIITSFFCTQQDIAILNNRELEKFTLVEIFENLAMTFLRGICTLRGLEIIDRYYKYKKAGNALV